MRKLPCEEIFSKSFMTLRKTSRKATSHTLKSQFHWGRVIQYVVAEGEKDKKAASPGQNGVSWFKILDSCGNCDERAFCDAK